MTTLRAPRPMEFAVLFVEDTKERTTHEASCHCGAVQFEVTLKYVFPKYPINRCTCSICVKNGYMLVYPCRRDVVFTRGLENVGTYAWNTKTQHHKFCKTCASSLMLDFTMSERGEEDPRKDIIGVNARMFKDLDLEAVEYTFFDGKNITPRVDGGGVDADQLAPKYRKVLSVV